MRYLKRYRWVIVGATIALLVVAFLAFRPDKLFVDDVVDESLDDAFAIAADGSPSTTTTTTTTTTTVAPTTTAASGAEATTPSPTVTSSTTTTTVPAGPVALVTGSFYGIDHAAEGTATTYELDGRSVLRFEDDTDIQNGPDLYVWPLADDDYESGTPEDFIDLGKIKGNVEGQNYELPPEFDPELARFVLIWCLRFRVPFAAAPLA